MEWANILNLGDVSRLLSAMDLDVSAPALFKYFLLLVMLIALLWVLGDVYRGEIQNRNMTIEIIAYQGNHGPNDVLFTRGTLDTRAERLPAKIILEHRFVIEHDGKVFSKTVCIARRPARLCMFARQSNTLRNGQFAFPQSVESAIKNRAEYLVREALRNYRRRPGNLIRRLIAKKTWTEPEAKGASYLARVHFPSNPYFLLFQHPDREVKATGWLTLLTSLFALFAQFLFAQPADIGRPPSAGDAAVQAHAPGTRPNIAATITPRPAN
jgi:hypothetical protein